MDYKHSHKTPRGHILTKMETMGTTWELYEKYFWTTWHLGQLGDQLTPLGNYMKNIWALLGIFTDSTSAPFESIWRPLCDTWELYRQHLGTTWEQHGRNFETTLVQLLDKFETTELQL